MSNFIRVLRNGTIYSSRDAAKAALQAQLAKLQDGEICLASYSTVTPSSWEGAKTILGVVRLKDGVRSYTIFDNEDIAGIVAKIEELNANKTSTGDSHVTVNVVEEKGVITAVNVTTADIASAALLGTTADAAGTDTAFARIAKEAAERTTAITNAINGLNGSVAATNDGLHVLTGVTQANGMLSDKTEIQLANVAISGSASDVAKAVIPNDGTYAAVEGENVSEQIASIAKTLKGISNTQANALKYRTVKLSDTEVTALKDSNVKEAYEVVSYIGDWAEGKGTVVGDTIKIYKDATIHKIYLGNTGDTIDETTGAITPQTTPKPSEKTSSLNYAYIKADGTYEMVKINVANFLRESEFKNGLDVNVSGEVSVKVDTTSEGAENFLSVGQNGVKISGVKNAIDTAIGKLDADVTSTGDNNVTVKVVETDGKVSGVTVTTPGLALDANVVKSVTVNEVPSTFANNNASLTIKGGNIAVADNYTATAYPEQFEAKVGTNHIAAGDKIDAAFKKTENTISVLATEVISNEKVTTAAITKLAESAGVVGADSVIGYQKKTDANYISTATSVHDATVKLDAAIKTVADSANNALTSVAGGNGIEVSTKTSNSQTVSLKLDTTKDGNGDGATPKPAGANALTVNANGLYLSNVWDCGEY